MTFLGGKPVDALLLGAKHRRELVGGIPGSLDELPADDARHRFAAPGDGDRPVDRAGDHHERRREDDQLGP